MNTDSNSNVTQAVRSLTTGAVTKINDSNKQLLKRNDMVEIGLDDEGEQVSGPTNVASVAGTGNLRTILRAIRGLEIQKQNLVASALKLKGGEATLVEHGFFDPEADNELVVAPGDEDEDETDSNFQVEDDDPNAGLDEI